MSAPVFTLCHATYGRPEKAIAAMRMALERATRPENVEYIFAINSDDRTADVLLELLNPEFAARPSQIIKVRSSDFAGSAPAWDAAAKVSTGQILIQMQDDLELPKNWDSALFDRIADYSDAEVHGKIVPAEPTVLSVRDGYRRDNLLCTAICNRARYEQQGEFLHAGYRSVFSDDEFSIRCYGDEADGKCQVIRTDLVFRHENPYHTGAPHDDTLRRENSPEAYALGGKLFLERNAALVARGFKTW